MFSTSSTQAPSGSVRGSRRRQRPLSNEASLSQPKAKRQRSALNDQTFRPPDDAPEMEEVKSQKVATMPRRDSSRETPGPRREIAVRGKKAKTGDRGNKADGAVLLTSNNTYAVSKLPALPDRLRTDVTVRQHGAIYSDSGYALTLTHSHAIVWPYAVNVPSPETFTFELPFPSKHGSDPLPLGSLVAASASSSEPGLVIIIPNSGNVTYWESIASAATLDLIRQQRNGVQLSIPGMLSGETVVQIMNAESVGFILGFSSGRIAYMSVRDGQGRPGISVQFIRGGNGPASGGIFGGIRNALSSTAWRGDIAAVRAGRVDKAGERDIVVATAKGKLQSWTIHRGGHSSLQAEVEERESITMAMKRAQPSIAELSVESFELLDFTHTPESIADTQLSAQVNNGTHLVLLASLSNPYENETHYFLVEVVLNPDGLTIGTVRPIDLYKTPISRTATSKVRLYLPNPALVAYVVFDRAVVVLSMAKQPESPDSQLRIESHIPPKAFEDVVDFRGDMNVEIVGSGMEEPHGPSTGAEDLKSRRHKAKHPAVVLIVRGGGVVRTAATDISKLISSEAPQVTAKGKLEQAVFFGTLEKNPISFAVRPELQFPAEQIGEAALALSSEIIKSQTPHIPAMSASIEINLRKRSAALQHLAEHLRTTGVALDRATRWGLLLDAERMAAAIVIWKKYDAIIKEKPEGQKRGVLTDIVESIHESYKSKPSVEAGELDRVRHWFINDAWNLELAIPWAYQCIKFTYQDSQKDHDFVLSTIYEANDLVIGALEEALRFRTANLNLYGLSSEMLEHGILEANYEGLPEFWSSTVYLAANVRKQTELVSMITKHFMNNPDKVNDPRVLEGIRTQNPALIDLAIRTSTERIRWSLAQDPPLSQIEAEEMRTSQAIAQDGQIIFLATELELPDEAIHLAERHRIMPTLASIVVMELAECADKIRDSGLAEEDFEAWGDRTMSLQNNVQRYFARFGTAWAAALYEHEIDIGAMGQLLDNYPEKHEFLTKFFRDKPEYSKLAWIHDVTREKDVEHAAETLLDLGLNRERDVWCKKIELSLGTMARVAGGKYSQSKGIILPDGGRTEITAARNELGLVKIQDQVYNRILHSVKDAIDEKAELQLALEAYSNKSLKKQKRSTSLLDESMGRLIRHEAMDALTLIDLLTLMGDKERPDDEELFNGIQFHLALQATCYGIADKDEQQLVQRVIWRRCMLGDDWAEVNNTDMKDDQQVSEQLRKTALYKTLRACFKDGMFEKGSTVKAMSPQDVLGACTTELDHRFNGLDAGMREEIMKDMQVEDDQLRPYMQRCRLDKWYQAATDLAKQDFAAEVDDRTDDGEQMLKAADKLREIEKGIAENERSAAARLLHAAGPRRSKSKVEDGSSRTRRLRALR